MLHVSKGAILLDTTTSLPHYNVVQPPPGQSFSSRSYLFSNYSAVKSYWCDLQCIALNTPLGKAFSRWGSPIFLTFLKVG